MSDRALPRFPESMIPMVRDRLPSCLATHGSRIGYASALHSTRASAGEKVLAAYDAGCRRFDAAMGGLGGCPFAQDDLVGNIPTEEVLQALEQRGVPSPLVRAIADVTVLNSAIQEQFATS